VTYQRTCDYCGEPFEAKRSHARWCSDPCSDQGWVEEQVYGALVGGQRVEQGVGSRGGNVRSVQEARELQEREKEKARYTLIAREHIARTLVETGWFHADDMQPLGIPEQHANVIGSQIASYVNRKLMTKVGERRCQHKAANGRKAAVYRITIKGRAELSKLLGLGAGIPTPQGEGGRTTARRSASVEPGESGAGPVLRPSRVARGVGENPQAGPASPESSSTGVEGDGVATPRGSLYSGAGETEQLFDAAPPSQYDPWEDAA